MKEEVEEKGNTGVLYGLSAYVLWGILPLYWKLLSSVPAMEVLAHRIFWSFIFLSCIVLWANDFPRLKKTFTNKKNLFFMFICAMLISINWFTYIGAVSTNQVVEASMGYYINPLISVLLSVIFLKERFNLLQCTAIGLATIGVLIMTLQYGKVPVIALTLALSFGFYGLIKKLLNVGAIDGLFIETAVIMPIALGYIIFKQATGAGAMGSVSFATLAILIGAGAATAIPMLLFAQAARRVKLSLLGFLQYLAPSISLFIGVVIFKEAFTSTHLLSFSFIWVALVIFSVSNLIIRREAQKLHALQTVTK